MKKVLYFLTHRLVLVGVALLMQLAVFFLMIGVFSENFTEFYWGCILLSILASLGIINSHTDPDYKIIWLVLILPFPVFGGMLYLILGGSSHPARVSPAQRRTRRPAPSLRMCFASMRPPP